MFDTSNNLTLEEINYDEEDPSISAISEIRYEDDYGFLNQFSFNGDHLSLTKMRVDPPLQKCEVQFYENGEKGRINEKSGEESLGKDMKFERKIAAMTLRENSFLKSPIKLPLIKSPIFLKVGSKQNQVLRGQLCKTGGQSQIALFDEQGNRKGSFNYYLQTKQSLKLPPNELPEDDTLQSHDFIEEIASIRKELRREQSPIKQKRLDVINRTTLNYSIIERIDSKSSPQNSDDAEDKKSQKSEIDYLGYSQSKLEERVGEYRLPMHQKTPTNTNQFNYQSIKRSMEDLGLSHHYNFQHFLQRRRFSQDDDESRQIIEQNIEIPEKETPVVQISFQDSGLQVEEMKPPVVQRGIGTYTPLSYRLNEEDINSSAQLPLKTHKTEQKNKIQQVAVPEDDGRQQQQPALKTSHMPRTHFVRSKHANDSSFQLESIKNQPPSNKRSQNQRQQLSMRNRVYEIRVGENHLDSRAGSRSSKRWTSCKESSSHRLNPSDSESVLYPEVDICVNNLSVNFHRKSFGAKMVQLSIMPTTYRTEALSGNNLIWIGKEYLFKNVNGSDELSVSLKLTAEDVEETLAQVKIRASDLILNKKKSYFQTFLLSKKQVVAILIVGFQILRKIHTVSKQEFPIKVARQTHAQTELSRSKTTKIKRSQKQEERLEGRQAGLPQPKANPIRVRKYKGGKNIKIGRASRFATGSANVPGPGDYHIESEFSRHALKDL